MSVIRNLSLVMTIFFIAALTSLSARSDELAAQNAPTFRQVLMEGLPESSGPDQDTEPSVSIEDLAPPAIPEAPSIVDSQARSAGMEGGRTVPVIGNADAINDNAQGSPGNPEALNSGGSDSRVPTLASLAPSSSSTGVVPETTESSSEQGKTTLDYSSIFYGPGLKGGGSGYVPSANGGPDQDRPVQMKNFLALGYNVTEAVNVAVVSYFLYQPIQGQKFVMSDPYFKMSHGHILQAGFFNLYSDLRYHVPVSQHSRDAQLRAGLQSVQVITYDDPDSPLVFNLYGSARTNFFGKRGWGNDVELYLGPNLMYQIAPHIGLTLLYEMSASHEYGAKAGVLKNDGTDLEPGVTWDVTPNLNLNPYMNLYPGNRISLDTTSFGMLLNWKLL